MSSASLWAYSAEKLFLMIAKQPDRGCAAMKAPVGLSSGRTFLREQDGGALPRQVLRVWLFCFFTKISYFLCSGYSCGAGLYGFYKMHCRRIRSLLRAKREPERTAVPAGHESPSGTFEPQTGLRSKCHYLLRPLPVKKQSRNDRSHSGFAIYKNNNSAVYGAAHAEPL